MTACGDVVFVDPDADLKAALRIESATAYAVDGDPRTYLRVVVGTRRGLDGARLAALLEADELVEIPLEGAAPVPCRTVQACFELVLGPSALEGAARVRLEVPRLGHASDGPLARRRLPPYAVDAEAQDENRLVRVQVRDPILAALAEETVVEGRRPFERVLEVQVHPGPCGAPRPEDWAVLESTPAFQPAALDADALGCVAIRPALPLGGPPVAQRTFGARAVVRAFQHVYQPPVVVAPLASLLLFDLEVPNAARCRSTQSEILSAVAAIARRIAEDDRRGAVVLDLSPIDLAVTDGVPCRQSPDRALDADAAARAVRRELEMQLDAPGAARLLVVYVANLPLAAPPAVRAGVTRLLGALSGEGVPTLLAAFAPEVALAEPEVEVRETWISPLDPSFRDALERLLGRVWPFASVSHGPGTVVPLASADQVRGLVAYRICAARPARVEPRGSRVGVSALAPTDGGPSYTIDLTPQVLAPPTELRVESVEVGWEGCFAFCDRAAPGRPSESVWLREDACCCLR